MGERRLGWGRRKLGMEVEDRGGRGRGRTEAGRVELEAVKYPRAYPPFPEPSCPLSPLGHKTCAERKEYYILFTRGQSILINQRVINSDKAL